MVINQFAHFNKWLQSCVRQYYLTSSWHINKNPLELAVWFSNAEVFLRDFTDNFPFIIPGRTMTILDLQTSEVVTITLVPPSDSDPQKSKISYFSPLGSALLGCKVGDIVGVKVFGREDSFQIIDVDS